MPNLLTANYKGQQFTVPTAGCTKMAQLLRLVGQQAKIDDKEIGNYAFLYAKNNIEFFLLDFNHWQTAFKECEVTLVEQTEFAKSTVIAIQNISKNLSQVGGNPDIKSLETLLSYNVTSNLSQTKDDDLEPYLEAFLSQNGLTELGLLLRVPQENIAKQAIAPLPIMFQYYCAHDYLKHNHNIIMDIYGKIEDDSSAEVKAIAFNCLNSLLSTMRSGSFNLIHKAAVKQSRMSQKPAYTGLIRCLSVNFKPCWTEALIFLNSMLVRCPSEKHRSQLMARLENLGLYGELRNLSKTNDPKVNKQLLNMQINTRQVLPTMQYEVEIHKSKVKQLQNHAEQLEKNISVYKEQQSLYKLMLGDFENYKNVYTVAKNVSTYYSPFTPVNQMTLQERQGVKTMKGDNSNSIVDLEEQMKNQNSNFNKLNTKLKEQESQIVKLNLEVKKGKLALDQEKDNKGQKQVQLQKRIDELNRGMQGERAQLTKEIEEGYAKKEALQKKLDETAPNTKLLEDTIKQIESEKTELDNEVTKFKKEFLLAATAKKAASKIDMGEANTNLAGDANAKKVEELQKDLVKELTVKEGLNKKIKDLEQEVEKWKASGGSGGPSVASAGPRGPAVNTPAARGASGAGPPRAEGRGPSGAGPPRAEGRGPSGAGPPVAEGRGPSGAGPPRAEGRGPSGAGPPRAEGRGPSGAGPPRAEGRGPSGAGPPRAEGRGPSGAGPPRAEGRGPSGAGPPRADGGRGPSGAGPPARGGGPPGRGDGPPARGGGPPARGGGPPARGGGPPARGGGPPGRGGGPPGRGAVGRGGGRGAVGRGGGGAKGPQPTKEPIKLSKKVKAFVWKRVILTKDAAPILWDNVKEAKVNQAEIEDMFEQKKQSIAVEGKADAKPTGPVEKEYLAPNDQRGLQLSLPKLPKYEALMTGITEYDRKVVTTSQIDSLLANWPKESDLEGFGAEKLEPNEKWARAEGYFINMLQPSSIQFRLQIWMFVENWPEVEARSKEFHDSITQVYDIIMNDKVLFEVFGYILAVGNVLNGGTAKGQADGFDLQVFGKVHMFRDNSGQSIMQYVCKIMKAKDDTFPEYIKALLKRVTTRSTNTDTFKAIATEQISKCGQAKSALDQVLNSGEGEDKFTTKMTLAVAAADKTANNTQKQKEELLANHTKCVIFYGLKPDEELAKDSPKYLQVFQEFIKNCDESMPPEEKKRGAGRPKGAQGTAAQPGGGMNAHMAEIQAMQAKRAAAAAAK